jgi:hypothetical protein
MVGGEILGHGVGLTFLGHTIVRHTGMIILIGCSFGMPALPGAKISTSPSPHGHNHYMGLRPTKSLDIGWRYKQSALVPEVPRLNS